MTAATLIAGVVGSPIRHSLSPRIHNAWIEAAGLDAVYVAFAPAPDRFTALVEGFRGGAILGLNVTAPFKEIALALADRPSLRAQDSGAANLLLFGDGGMIAADNTDGEGLLVAFANQAPRFDPAARPILILGAGGAARGAASAFLGAGSPAIHIVNRNRSRGEDLARRLGARTSAPTRDALKELVGSVGAVINATPAGLEAMQDAGVDPSCLPASAVVMDMVYRPILTPLLAVARARGLGTVDGLEMLISQARPSFEAMFGCPPPHVNVRALVLAS